MFCRTLQGGRFKEAIPNLESLEKNPPDNVQVLYNLGVTHSEVGEFDETIFRLKRAVKLDPLHAQAWTAIGHGCITFLLLRPLQKGRITEADPSDGYARRNLGVVLLCEGKSQAALDHLRGARKALPYDSQPVQPS